VCPASPVCLCVCGCPAVWKELARKEQQQKAAGRKPCEMLFIGIV